MCSWVYPPQFPRDKNHKAVGNPFFIVMFWVMMPLKLTHAFSLEILALQGDITLNIQRKKVKLVIHCGSAPLFYTIVGYIFWNIKSCLRRKFGEQRHSYMCDVISMIHFYQSPKSRPMFKALVPGGNMCVCASMGVGYGTISLMWHGGFILCKYLLLERRFRWISDKIAGMLFCKKREKHVSDHAILPMKLI